MHVVRGRQVWQCAGCRLATWDWAPFDPASFYDESYWTSTQPGKGYADYFGLAAAMRQTHRRRLTWLARHLRASRVAFGSVPPRGWRLLDAGCGPGFFVEAAARAGFAAAGVEVSAFAVAFARDRLGESVWQGQVKADDLGDGPYDVVTMWDVIEHLPDPVASLAAARNVLARGGLLAISTGDISSLSARLSGPRWHLFNLPEHLWFFTPESLRRLLRRTGFEPVQWRYAVSWYTLRYVAERIEAMFGNRGLFSTRLGSVGGCVLPVTLADVMTVLARRPVGTRRAGERGR